MKRMKKPHFFYSLKSFHSTNSDFDILFRFAKFLFWNIVEEEKVVCDALWPGVPRK